MAGAYVQQPGEGERRWMERRQPTFSLPENARTGLSPWSTSERNRGMSVPLHRHSDDMESFYVIEGEITLFPRRPTRNSCYPAGSFAHIPGGTVHGFRIESETALVT